MSAPLPIPIDPTRPIQTQCLVPPCPMGCVPGYHLVGDRCERDSQFVILPDNPDTDPAEGLGSLLGWVTANPLVAAGVAGAIWFALRGHLRGLV